MTIRILKESQLREYRRLVSVKGKAEALAIFKRDLIFKMGSEWWDANKQAVNAELGKVDEEKK